MEDQKEKVSVSNNIEMNIDHMQPEPFAEKHESEDTNGGGATDILPWWRKREMIKVILLVLRGIATIFSLISFIVLRNNRHGSWKDFYMYEEYRYLLDVALLSFFYSGVLASLQFREYRTGKSLMQPRTEGLIGFVGDQVVAYLLISSISSAIPMTDRMRQIEDNEFTISSVTAIVFSFFAFCCLAPSAVISGYKLKTQSYTPMNILNS